MWRSVDPGITRAVALYGTFALLALAFYWRRGERQRLGVAITCAIVIAGPLLALNVAAESLGWWTFGDATGTFYGMPVDLWLTWTLLWGAGVAVVMPLRARWWHTTTVVAGFVVADMLVMPLYDPVVVLHDSWLVGEVVGALTILLPAALLAQASLQRRRTYLRGLVQAAGFGFAMFYMLPMAVFDVTGEDWSVLLGRSTTWWAVSLAAVAPFGLLALAGMWEFLHRGNGTPVPFDPPVRLVTTGPYAYVANPMQLGMTGVLVGYGMLAGSWALTATALGAAAFSMGYAAAFEHEELVDRYGDAWLEYRQAVKLFVPRTTPYRIAVDRTVDAREADGYERTSKQTSHHAAGYQPG